MAKNRLQQLQDFGQSPWVDSLSRRMIESGELQELIDLGIVGVTSNPTIFDQAISESDVYNDQIRDLIARGLDVNAIYEALAIQDIQNACDLLRPVYERTGGLDGYVSLEASPFLAFDTDGTLVEVRRLWQAIDRPNVMIKIPGTREGIPAIEQALYEGINVNITLLFSLDAYREVIEAYLRAMERRVDEGKPVDGIASVASFFVSRVDTEVDNRLKEIIEAEPGTQRAEKARSLLGKVAVANAKLAYQEFTGVFGSSRFERLREAGARIQRPLWASTSTKNPEYSDTLYIDELIGPDTVNTMTRESIDAFLDHGTVERTVDRDVDLATQVINDLASVGIAYSDVNDTLVSEGVTKFADSFRSLLNTLKEQSERVTA